MKSCLMFVAAAIAAAAPARAQAPDRGTVVGYIAAFEGVDRAIDRGGFENYTQLDLAFANPTPAGEMTDAQGLACAPSVRNGPMISDAQMQRLVTAVHGAGAKLVVSLGGATVPACGGDWAQLLAPQTRDRVVSNIVGMVDRYGLDGVDVDIEGELLTAIDRAGNFTPFVVALSGALHPKGKLLTAATGSYPGGMIPDGSLPFFDVIGIMSYDYVGPTWGTPGAEHSTLEQAQKDLALWIGKGVPVSRLAVGVPFYGRGFGTYTGSASLQQIVGLSGKDQLKSDVLGQRCGGCSYVTYNGLPTLERKAELAGAWGAGVMVWQIGQDMPDNSAIRHINAAYRKGRALARRR